MPAATLNKNTWGEYERITGERKGLRTIWMSSGEHGVGKSRFALTAPGPILVQSLDKGTEGLIESMVEEDPSMAAKGIYVKEYDWDPFRDDFDKTYAESIREEIMKDYMFGLQHARTIIWDKETDIREVFQYAEFGSPTGGNVRDYGRLNQTYFNVINRAKSVPHVNFGLIQGMKDEWVEAGKAEVNPRTGQQKFNRKKSGRRIRAGFDRLGEIVMLELHHERRDGEFFIQVGKARQQRASAPVQDQEFPGCTFAQFGTLLIPGTEETEWMA